MFKRNVTLYNRVHKSITGQFADKTCGQSSGRLVNLQTIQLADSEFLKITELLHYFCMLNQNVTLSNIYSV